MLEMPNRPAAGNRRVGRLQFELKISCSEATRAKLDLAARRFVQANYDAIQSLTTNGSNRVPFCIRAGRNDRGRTILCVSVVGGAGDDRYTGSGRWSQQKNHNSRCGASFRALIEGEVACHRPAGTPGKCSSAPGSHVLVDVLLAADDVTEAAGAAAIEAPEAPLVSPRARRAAEPLVADFYDTEERGRQLREKFRDLRGEYFIFYSHGETHCRRMLDAMGFKEAQPDQEDNRFRPVEKMAVMWCSGTNSGAKRKGGLGYYIVNRLRYRGLIANKCSLSRCLKEFELNHPHLIPPGLQAASFYPDTVHLNGSDALRLFKEIRNHRGLFLLKPGHTDCGRGIALHRSSGSLAQLVADLTSSYASYAFKDLVMQRYVDRPLLIDGRKFDLRVYLLLVPNLRRGNGQRGLYAFCHPGYARLACRRYQLESDDPMLHLTNQAVQQRDPTYAAVKEDTVWSPDRLNDHLNSRRRELGVPCHDWVPRRLFPRIRAVLGHVISIASSSLCDQPMSYELMGCDFLVDADFNVWLLEINSDPSLSKATRTLGRIVTQAVEESVGLAVEVLQLAARSLPAKRLVTRQDFCKIFSHTNESVLRRVLAAAGVDFPGSASTD